ncbi:MAG: DNA adenine methylase [Pseudomonadota bacterium]
MPGLVGLASVATRQLEFATDESEGRDGCEAKAAPFLKWAGGKKRLLDELVVRSPLRFRRYYEPFLGGGALFFGLAPRQAYLSDANEELIACYHAVRDETEQVIEVLAQYQQRHSASHYYEIRQRWNEERDELDRPERAAAFIYLNRTCYNGLWRVNSRGAYNVPLGSYVRPRILNAAVLRSAAHALRSAVLESRSFEWVLDSAGPDDFVYFDPPYDPLSATSSFTSYTAGCFGDAEQACLASAFRELDRRGCTVVLSNNDTPLIRRLYAGFELQQVYCSRAINSRASGRKAIAELIVTNGRSRRQEPSQNNLNKVLAMRRPDGKERGGRILSV